MNSVFFPGESPYSDGFNDGFSHGPLMFPSKNGPPLVGTTELQGLPVGEDDMMMK